MTMENAIEGSTYAITVTFRDDEGALVVPSSATWTLSDPCGDVINARDGIAIGSLASSVTVVLSGNDLDLVDDDDTGERIFTVEAVYSSDLGNDLPMKSEVTFTITALVNV